MKTQPTTPRDQQLIASMDHLVREAGGDPEAQSGKLVREVMHTALKLVRDRADTGELKLISRSLKELRYALKVFRSYRAVRKVSIFGSARTQDDQPEYAAAELFSRLMAGEGWMVITGAGGGIMRAGHGGAGREKSFGVAIRLPFETTANEYIHGDAKLIVFRYFFTRKLMFASQSHAVALLPGGFGTQDEGFEILTLVQTGKAPLVPIVLIDPPGGSYWRNWDRYVREDLLANGLISPQDTGLYFLTDQPERAVEHVLQFYRNFHSYRFVRDELVIRMRRVLEDAQVAALNEEFADLVESGQIEQSGFLEEEVEHIDLPRLRFNFTRRDYGRLRLMLDRINAMDAQNHPQISAGDSAGP